MFADCNTVDIVFLIFGSIVGIVWISIIILASNEIDLNYLIKSISND